MFAYALLFPLSLLLRSPELPRSRHLLAATASNGPCAEICPSCAHAEPNPWTKIANAFLVLLQS